MESALRRPQWPGSANSFAAAAATPPTDTDTTMSSLWPGGHATKTPSFGYTGRSSSASSASPSTAVMEPIREAPGREAGEVLFDLARARLAHVGLSSHAGTAASRTPRW